MEVLNISNETFLNSKFQLNKFGNREYSVKFPNQVLTQQKLKINKCKENMKESVDSGDKEKVSPVQNTALGTIETVKKDIIDENMKTKPKKKKKWKKIEPSTIGINLSLFPRPVKTTETDSYYKFKYVFIEKELEETEILTEPYAKLVELEGNTQSSVKYLRADRDRKVMKVHKQVKTKHCKSLLNNKGRKSLYINHRVYKLMELDIHRLCYMPSQKKAKNALKREATHKDNYRINPATNKPHQQNLYRPTPVQCLAHAIHKDNLPTDLDSAVANLLMNIQHRDLTPEDYDLLLRLDERVAPKTISENKLKTFKTEKVENNDALEVCPICMELYEIGQIRKYLPCDHKFHCDCIDAWLKNSSMNCPIDNLPIDS